MAGAAARPHRRDVPRRAARGARRHHAHQPEIFRAAHDRTASWLAAFVCVANIEASDGGAAIVAGNERVLRARLADAQVLLGAGPQGRRSKSSRRSWTGSSSTPSSARMADKVERLWRWPVAGRRMCPGRRSRRRPSARRCWPRPTSSPAWSASSPSCRASWAATTPQRRASPPRSPTPSATTTRPRAPTTAARRPEQRRRGPGRQARHARGLLRRRHQPDRLQGSVRAAPRRARHHPADLRERPAAAAAACVVAAACAAMASGSQAMSGAAAAELLAFLADRLKVHLRERGVRHDLVAAVFALGEEDDLVRLLRPRRGAAGVPRQRGRQQPAHRLPPGQQHRRDRGEEGRARATTASRSPAHWWSRQRRPVGCAWKTPGREIDRGAGGGGLRRRHGGACQRCAGPSTLSSTA